MWHNWTILLVIYNIFSSKVDSRIAYVTEFINAVSLHYSTLGYHLFGESWMNMTNLGIWSLTSCLLIPYIYRHQIMSMLMKSCTKTKYLHGYLLVSIISDTVSLVSVILVLVWYPVSTHPIAATLTVSVSRLYWLLDVKALRLYWFIWSILTAQLIIGLTCDQSLHNKLGHVSNRSSGK